MRKSFCLERLVYKRRVNSVLAELVLAVLLPALAFLSVLANLCLALGGFLRRKQLPRGHHEFHNLQFAREFGFEHAIEAYEELIDATISKRRA
jgi:hypothetical protein